MGRGTSEKAIYGTQGNWATSLGWSNKGELFILKLTTARILVGLADHLTIITMTQVTWCCQPGTMGNCTARLVANTVLAIATIKLSEKSKITKISLLKECDCLVLEMLYWVKHSKIFKYAQITRIGYWITIPKFDTKKNINSACWVIFNIFVICWLVKKKKAFQEHYRSVEQFGSILLSGLIWVQTVCKNQKQTTKFTAGRLRV